MAVGNTISGVWRSYIDVTSTSSNETTTTVYFNYGVELVKSVSSRFSNKYNTSNLPIPTTDYYTNAGKKKYGSTSRSFSRTKSNYTATISYWLKHSGSGADWKGTSTTNQTVTIYAKPSYAVTYNPNKPSEASAEPTNIPASQTKWYGENLTLASNVPMIDDIRYSFKEWNTNSDPDAGTSYIPSQVYSGNTALTLLAIWNPEYPPSCDVDGFELGGKISEAGNGIKNFTDVSVNLTNITSYNDGENKKTITGIKLFVGTDESASVVPSNPQEDLGGNTHYDDLPITLYSVSISGDLPVRVEITDSESKVKSISLGDVTVIDPTWTRTIEVGSMPPPVINGNAVLDSFEVYNYNPEVDDWETIYGQFPITIVSDDPNNPLWTFDYTFTENYVDDTESLTPKTNVRIDYKHYDSYEKPYREAFFNTTRNQNFSNGIYNVMFIGGVEDNPDFTSRVWWSQINNPLYFPDTNYIEVGSNDTMVMGLTKVGDYLAVIKQSKTTDTAIFLVYPTSFEDETTYAVRQGVQGIGALARYSFNILGDETLFLSPKGVMAVVPSQDEEHKVQNRSYFVDGRLLNEPDIQNSYSFVFDGKYFLAMGSGAVYVLDGNQRNSWGNDRTNLVYECYYLDNIPAQCFVKYQDKLVFSTYTEVCVVGDSFEDAYGYDEFGERIENPPVKAEWSTILDDDGSLHYYKTMQKKGNLVSILPKENEQPYKQVYIDEETFNANKELYFTLEDGEYVRCSADSVYDSDTQYFVENRTNTKVFVKKDGNDEVEIERTFSLSSDVPSEMFLKKKFKKYKRLQFIIRNDAPEPFGVDSIIKNYTVGNYAKK